MTSARHNRGRRRRPRRRIGLLRPVLAAVGIVLAVAGWMAFRGVEAKDHLLNAASLVSTLQSDADVGNVAGERTTLVALQRQTADARSETTDPVWRIVSVIPVVGHNTGTVAAMAQAVDSLATQALPPLIAASAAINLSTLAPHDGQLDLASIHAAVAPLTTADQTLEQVQTKIDGLSTSGLVPPVTSAVTRLRTELASATNTTATAMRAVTLLPAMLGANGPRTYALLFLNNAELRADGGIPGSWAMVRADQGRVTIVNQGSAASVNAEGAGVAVPADVAALFTNRAGTFFQDVTLTPNFPAAAQLAASMLQKVYGVPLDGVVATDPVALSELLRATGPVSLITGESLTADNAVSLLLSDVYQQLPDPAEQDLFFAEAAKSVFDALSDGQGDPRKVVQSLANAADQGRVSVWSAHAAEERQLEATPLAGALPAVDAPGQPSIGVFLDDGTAAKLDYYLREQVDVAGGSCPPNGVGYQVRISLTSEVPKAATSLPAYVLGNGLPGLPAGTIRTQVYVYSPVEGAVTTATANGAAARLGTGTDGGRAVGIVTVDLTPGASSTLDIGVDTGALPAGVRAHSLAPVVRVTPMAVAAVVHSATASCPNG